MFSAPDPVSTGPQTAYRLSGRTGRPAVGVSLAHLAICAVEIRPYTFMITHKLLKLLIRSSRPGAMFPAPDRRLERTTPQTAYRLSGRTRELAAHVGSVSSVWRTLPSALSRSDPTHKVLKLLLSSSWPWGMFSGPSPSRADPRPLTVFPVGPENWRLGVGRAFDLRCRDQTPHARFWSYLGPFCASDSHSLTHFHVMGRFVTFRANTSSRAPRSLGPRARIGITPETC
jgi:hypothetical protein